MDEAYIRRRKTVAKKFEIRARFRSTLVELSVSCADFQMHDEHMQRLWKLRHGNLHSKRSRVKIRIRVAPLIQVGAMEITLRCDDSESGSLFHCG